VPIPRRAPPGLAEIEVPRSRRRILQDLSERCSPGRRQGADQIVADAAVTDLQLNAVDGGQQLILLQLFEDSALRQHRGLSL